MLTIDMKVSKHIWLRFELFVAIHLYSGKILIGDLMTQAPSLNVLLFRNKYLSPVGFKANYETQRILC